VCHFFMCRRAKDVLRLTADEIFFSRGGGVAFLVTRKQTDARKPGGERLAHIYPAINLSTITDVPVLLLRNAVSSLLTHFLTTGGFVSAPAADPGGSLTTCLRSGPRLLDVTAPVGTLYASHSYRRKSGAALRKVGLGLGVTAQWAGMTLETLI